jgi:hypothetical protein
LKRRAELSIYEISNSGIICTVKIKELSPKQLLSVPCPTCGAAIGEGCELHTGALRTEPHRDRKLSAADAVERKQMAAAQGNG